MEDNLVGLNLSLLVLLLLMILSSRNSLLSNLSFELLLPRRFLSEPPGLLLDDIFPKLSPELLLPTRLLKLSFEFFLTTFFGRKGSEAMSLLVLMLLLILSLRDSLKLDILGVVL